MLPPDRRRRGDPAALLRSSAGRVLALERAGGREPTLAKTPGIVVRHEPAAAPRARCCAAAPAGRAADYLRRLGRAVLRRTAAFVFAASCCAGASLSSARRTSCSSL